MMHTAKGFAKVRAVRENSFRAMPDIPSYVNRTPQTIVARHTSEVNGRKFAVQFPYHVLIDLVALSNVSPWD